MSVEPVTPSNSPELTPVAVAKYIGREYVEAKHLPCENDDLTVGHIYDAIGHHSERLLSEIPVPVIFQEKDPYDDYQDMAESVGREQCLRVYNQHTNHPYLSHDEQLAFRAVHDWFGHLSADVDFSPAGEFKKWEHMKRYDGFDGKAVQSVMFAEVVGQVGVVHYLKDGFADDRYEQRAFMAPDNWIMLMKSAVR
jgi:hypothetical protein